MSVVSHVTFFKSLDSQSACHSSGQLPIVHASPFSPNCSTFVPLRRVSRTAAAVQSSHVHARLRSEGGSGTPAFWNRSVFRNTTRLFPPSFQGICTTLPWYIARDWNSFGLY